MKHSPADATSWTLRTCCRFPSGVQGNAQAQVARPIRALLLSTIYLGVLVTPVRGESKYEIRPNLIDKDHCTMTAGTPVLLPIGMTCPLVCPYTQPIEGVSCEKVCVSGHLCAEFHPVRFFPNNSTMRCEPPCGAHANGKALVKGCTECAGPGVCKRCARGLFGITVLELSEDGLHCVNRGQFWWYLFYCLVIILMVLVAIYVADLVSRPVENSQVLESAMRRREEARTELMPEDQRDRRFFNTPLHCRGGVAEWLGGRGVVLYFNWLVFAALVALIMSVAGFLSFEMSDLALTMRKPVVCRERQRAVHRRYSTVSFAEEDSDANATAMPMFLAIRDHPHSHRHALKHHSHRSEADLHSDMQTTTPAAETKELVDTKKIEVMKKQQDIEVPISEEVQENSTVDAIIEKLRILSSPVQGKPTHGIIEKYKQFHRRMFYVLTAGVLIVVMLSLGFTAWQLQSVSGYFDSEVSSRQFTACVEGVPRDLVDGQKLTQHFREAFHGDELLNLWKKHEPRQTKLDAVPISDRFRVVGTSIAYDFHEKEEDVMREVHSWIVELENTHASIAHGHSKSFDLVTAAGKNIRTQGVQTESRGDVVSELLQEDCKEDAHTHFVDRFVLGALGLSEDVTVALQGSGVAFVIFATTAARDAAVTLSHSNKLAPFLWQGKQYKLKVKPARCEPVSINWESFRSWRHLPQKIVLGVLAMLLTVCGWIMLYAPYAMFYADSVVVPGLAPDFVQNISLGILISMGNAVLSVVIDKVTDWAGARYKDDRDAAVMVLAFLGTLLNTGCDLLMVAVVARGVMVQKAFSGKDSGYDTVVAHELFNLMVPGYLLLPYFGGPLVEHVIPYWLATYLIRSHVRVSLHKATGALRCPNFDICWRYSDMLNNTTLCFILLYFTSSRGWKVMIFLLLFIVLIYTIDKYLLLNRATVVMYDTPRLSLVFASWWCVPLTVLAGLVVYWGMRAQFITNQAIAIGFMVWFPIMYLATLAWMQAYFAQQNRGKYRPLLYPEAIQGLRKSHRPWDFFNTNPVYCLRTRCLGPAQSGWHEVAEFLDRYGGDGVHTKVPRTCAPFMRGSVRVLTTAYPADTH